MTSTMLSVDPGKRGCGCAIWRDSVLVAADYIAGGSLKSLDGPRLFAETATRVGQWAVRMLDENPHVLAVEFPTTYGGRSSKGDTRDLLGLAGVDAALAMYFNNAKVEWRVPHDWKAGIQKPQSVEDVYSIQARVIDRLTPEERERVRWPANRRHQWDVADACGLGLSVLGRFERKRVYAVE